MANPRFTRSRPIALTLTLAGLAGPVLGLSPGASDAAAASKTTKKAVKKPTTPSKTTTTKKSTTKSTTNPVGAAGTGGPPNILFVLADDLGVDASPCYPQFGSVKPNMPTVQQLCNDGVVFDNMTASPVCSPSRAAAITGKYAFRTNVGNVDDELSPDETTVFDVVSTAPTPYANAAIGKWHLGGSQADATQPERLGVQYFDGFLRGQVQDYSNWPRVTQGQTSTSSTYTTTAFTDSAIAWTAQQTKPWFLWMAYNAPHAPFHLPPANLLAKNSLNGTTTDIAQNPRAYYLASLEALDSELGRLLKSLPATTRSNTIVMFMGDNGTPARVTQAPFSAANSKGSVTEGGVHVPLIVAGAGVTDKGTRSAALLNGVDLLPTVAALTGTKVSGQIDGQSFAAQLKNSSTPGSRMFAYSELFSGTSAATSAGATGTTGAAGGAGGAGRTRRPGATAGTGSPAGSSDMWAVRDDRYKLVHDVTTGEERLYDLQTDPGETVVLPPAAGPNTEIIAKLRSFVTRLRA